MSDPSEFLSESSTRPQPAAHDHDPLVPLGWDGRRRSEFDTLAPPGALPGRVVRVDRGSVLVLTSRGTRRGEPARALREDATGPEALPTAGDWVALLPRPRHATDEVAAVLPRRSAFVRRDPGNAVAAQVVAANIDVACIVHPATKPNPRRLEREVTLVWESGAVPVVVLTKADLAPDPGEALALLSAAAPGVPVHAVSAPQGLGIEAVRGYAAGDRTLAFLGASGVGKSTLANALLDAQAMATGEVRANDQRGRHTTTARHLLPLPGGGAILDTPGMRAVAIWDAGEGLGRAFADVEAFAEGCRFRDCRHASEPGCAVQQAVRDGRLASARLDAMRALEREMEHVRRKQDERLRAERRQQMRAQGRDARRRERERPKDRWRE